MACTFSMKPRRVSVGFCFKVSEETSPSPMDRRVKQSQAWGERMQTLSKQAAESGACCIPVKKLPWPNN